MICVDCGRSIPTPTPDPFRCPDCRHPVIDPRDPPVQTHYVPVDAPTYNHGQQALCGRFVDPRRDFATEPSCPTCRTIIAEEERQMRDLGVEFADYPREDGGA